MARRIPTKTRAAAIADLQAGEQPAVVAERYGLEMSTVRVWKARFVTVSETQHVAPAPVRPTIERQQAEIGALVLDLLAAKLKASQAIAEAASDQAWLKQQAASELAALGEWLDTTAFAIGDRLAGGRAAEPTDRADAGE